MSHVINEVAGVLGLILKHATTKHAQTIGLHERSHASTKQALKIETGDRRSFWHKYVSVVVLNYNTSYHASIGCEPSRVFHGCFPFKNIVWKWVFVQRKFPLQTQKSPKMCLNRRKWFSRMSAKMPSKPISNTKRIMIERPMRQNSNKLNTFTSYSQKQITKDAKFSEDFLGNKEDFRWIGPYFIEKVLPNDIY